MSVVRWSPFREFDNLFQTIERPSPALRRADWLPLVDIRETDQEYKIDVEVPAVAAEDLSVAITDGVLSVSGERKALEEVDDEGRVHRVERRYGKFVRNFQLPDDADPEQISAQSRDGVLYLSVAKRQTAQSRSIDIKVA